jgi:hypothetical protein
MEEERALELSGLVWPDASVACGRGVPAEILQIGFGLLQVHYSGSDFIKGIAGLPSLLFWLQLTSSPQKISIKKEAQEYSSSANHSSCTAE